MMPQSFNGLIVAMPTRGSVSVETLTARENNLPLLPRITVTVPRRDVVAARNEIGKSILELMQQGAIDSGIFVLWHDDDAWWPAGTVEQMIVTLRDNPTVDLLAASFGERIPFCKPGAFRKDFSDAVVPGVNCSLGDVVPVKTVGGHFLLHRAALLEKVGPDPFNVPSDHRFAEDMAFCKRIRDVGGTVAVATGIVVAHVEASTGLAFIPGARPGRIVDNQFQAVPDARTDAEIIAAYTGSDLRGKRTYGFAVEQCHAKLKARSRATQPKPIHRPVRDTRAAAEWLVQHDSDRGRLADRAR